MDFIGRIHPLPTRQQNSLKSLFYFHAGDLLLCFQQSSIWKRTIEPVFEFDDWDVDLPFGIRLPRCHNANDMIINIIDDTMYQVYHVAMQRSHDYDRDSKVYNSTSTKECLRKLFREHWMNEEYEVEEEYVEDIDMDGHSSSGLSEETDENSEDPWKSMRGSVEEGELEDSLDSSYSEESYQMNLNEMAERNKQIWQGL